MATEQTNGRQSIGEAAGPVGDQDAKPMQLWLVQPDPWGSGDGVDGFVIRAESKQAAEVMATEYHEPGNGVWLAKPLTPEGDAKILFGAERSCWELGS